MLDGIKSGDINTIMSGSWFDSEGFTKTMTDKRTWAGTASSMVATGVTTGLTAANLGNGVNNMGNDFKNAAERNKALLNSADKVSGFNVGQINDMLSMNSFIGSMAGAGVTYAMTGNVSFNVLNASDLTGGALQGGLLQMNLGKDGFSMEIGMGGTNVSAGVIASAMRGGQNWDKNTQIKRAAAANNMDVATTLRSQWGYGDAKAKSQLESIIRGDTKLSSGKRDGDAQTVLENGSRVVYLNNYKPGMSTADQLALGITLGHEAHRDGISGPNNYLETRSAVTGHTEMAIRMLRDGQGLSMSANLQNDIGAYMMGQDVFNAYVDGIYDSSGDYWKMTADGSLAFDGKTDLFDENGNMIYDAANTGLQGSLSEILGITLDEAYYLMDNSDMTYEGTWDLKSNYDKTIGLETRMGEGGQGRTYGEIYTSRVLKDVITGQIGTIFDLNPINIYNKMVSFDMTPLAFDPTAVTQSNGMWNGRLPVRELSYEEWKDNNYITDVSLNLINMQEPVEGTVSSPYGNRTNPLTRIGVEFHTGTDWAVIEGTAFNPFLTGTVSDITQSASLGNVLTLEHDMSYMFKGEFITTSLFTNYMHLQSNETGGVNTPYSIGDTILSGSIAGYTGNTGTLTTGAHLHAGMYFKSIYNNPYANWLNMQNYITKLNEYNYYARTSLFY